MKPRRFDLEKVAKAFEKVQENWQEIDDELDRLKIGRKDTRFDDGVRTNMMRAYEYIDELLKEGEPPFQNLGRLLEVNHRVHYGTNWHLRHEYHKATEATSEKFYRLIDPIQHWYEKHTKRHDSPLKVAAEIYVAILGQPQLFIEGNHRSGAVIASWINMYHGYAPFVLTVHNAIPYFAPSAEIKKFADKASWRGQMRLPKYRRSFREFWEAHIQEKFAKER